MIAIMTKVVDIRNTLNGVTNDACRLLLRNISNARNFYKCPELKTELETFPVHLENAQNKNALFL